MKKSKNTIINAKKYSSKYHLKKEMEIIIEKLNEYNRAFQLYKCLLKEDNKAIIYKHFPYLFTIILNSLEEKFVLGLYKTIYDIDSNGKNICIIDIIKRYEKDKKHFTEKKYYYINRIDINKKVRRYLNPIEIKICINKIKSDLNNSKELKLFLHDFRRKTIAHLDKKYSFNSNIKYSKKAIKLDDIESLINIFAEDMNNLYNSLFGISYTFLYNESDELQYLNNIIKSYLNE